MVEFSSLKCFDKTLITICRIQSIIKGKLENMKRITSGIMLTLLLIGAIQVQAARTFVPFSLPWGDWTHYHNYSEIVNTLLYLNLTYPDLVDVFSIGKSWQNNDIYCARLTNENITCPKPEVLFVGYHHARELISAELPLYFAVNASSNYGLNETITYILNYSEIYIVPALNVDGLEVVEQNEWQRKNAHPVDEDGDDLLDEDPPDDEDGDGYIEDLFFNNGTHYEFIRWEGLDDDGDGLLNEDWVGGVDLNRNYGFQWNASVQSGSPYPWDEDYRGPSPFSEPETQALRDFVMDHDFKYAISFHSGSECVVYPWGFTTVPSPDEVVFVEIAQKFSNMTGVWYGQSGDWYTTSGVWDDWMYGNRSVFALTCEIYQNNSALQYEPGPEPNTWWRKGIFQYFNPPPNQIEAVIKRWLPVFTYIANKAVMSEKKYDQNAPRAGKLLISLFDNATAEFEALKRGEIDIVDSPLSKTVYDELSQPPYNETIQIVNYGPEFGLFILDMNSNPNEYLGNPPDPAYPNPVYPNPMANVWLRRAIGHLINRSSYIADPAIGVGFGYPMYTTMPPAMAKYLLDVYGNTSMPWAWDYDPSAAAAILDDPAKANMTIGKSGYREWLNPVTGEWEIVKLIFYIRSDHAGRSRIGTVLMQEMQNLGFYMVIGENVHYAPYETCFIEVMVNKNFHMYTGGWSLGVDPDHLILWSWDYYWHPGFCYNYGGHNDLQFNEAAKKVMHAITQDEAVYWALKAQERQAIMALGIPLYCTSGYKAFHKTNTGIAGFSGPAEDSTFGQAWKGIVNIDGYGIDNGWAFMHMHTNETEYASDMIIDWGMKVPELNKLNPIYASLPSDWNVLHLLYESLLVRDPSNLGEFLPWLAESFEVGTYLHPTLGNCSKIIFTLRPDIYWSDGTPLTVADVYFTYVELKQILESHRLPPPWWYSNVQYIRSFNILDPYRFEVLLDVKSYWAVGWIGENIILPKHIWKPICETGDPFEFAPDPNMIGSGPWRLVEYVAGSHVKLVANVPGSTVTTNIQGADPGTPITSPYGYWRLNPCLPAIVGLSSKADAGTYSFNVTVDNKLQTSSMTINKTVEIDGAVVASATDIVIQAGATHPETITYPFDYGIHNVTVTVEYTAGSFQGTKTIVKYVWITKNEDILGTTWYDIAGYTNYPYKNQLEAPDIKVDLKDVFATALAFGSYPGHTKWNSVCDINGDYQVDLKDFFAIANKFGWTG